MWLIAQTVKLKCKHKRRANSRLRHKIYLTVELLHNRFADAESQTYAADILLDLVLKSSE